MGTQQFGIDPNLALDIMRTKIHSLSSEGVPNAEVIGGNIFRGLDDLQQWCERVQGDHGMGMLGYL